MQIVIFNTTASAIKRTSDSMAIRVAYLFGNTIALIGDFIYEFRYDELFSRLPLPNKIDLVENIYRANNEHSTVDFDQLRYLTKTFNKTKNKEPTFIKLFKKMEHSFGLIYKEVIDNFIHTKYVQSGFAELINLLDDDAINYFSTNNLNLEKPNKTAIEELKESSILSLDFDEANQPKLLLLHEYFFKLPSVACTPILDASDVNAGIITNIMLQPLFTIPNIQFLKVAELQLLREKLDDLKKTFFNKTNDWIEMCFSNKNFEHRQHIFKNEILPISTKINDFLEEDVLIKHLKNVTKMDFPMTICFAEVPFQMIVDYYANCAIIKKETVEAMNKLQLTEDRFKQKWPVIFLITSTLEELKNNTEKDKNDEILIPKKSININ